MCAWESPLGDFLPSFQTKQLHYTCFVYQALCKIMFRKCMSLLPKIITSWYNDDEMIIKPDASWTRWGGTTLAVQFSALASPVHTTNSSNQYWGGLCMGPDTGQCINRGQAGTQRIRPPPYRSLLCRGRDDNVQCKTRARGYGLWRQESSPQISEWLLLWISTWLLWEGSREGHLS